LEELALPSEGQASKNGGAVHPFSQKPWPISQTSKNSFKKKFKIQKNWDSLIGAGVDLRLAGDRGSTPVPVELFPFF
jgi:hypothetical protein